MTPATLPAAFAEAVSRHRDRPAVVETGRQVTYAELGALVARLADDLRAAGVERGDRVAVWLPKTIEAVAAQHAAMALGAAYVPVDASGPDARARLVLDDCAPRACVTDDTHAARARAAGCAVVASPTPDEVGAAGTLDGGPAAADDLAYILYTSGSTGMPKGVCLSQRNAMAFVGWAHDELRATSQDRFASHAPLHFDLSILDLYVPCLAGAATCLLPDGAGYLAPALMRFIHEQRVTVWYSVPSALMLLEGAGLLGSPTPALRAVCFAGEPYPVPALRRLRAGLADVRLLNLYGPTETNVCTWHEVDTLPDPEATAIPIGRACSGDHVWARRDDGELAAPGERGELIVEGPSVMTGYWGRAPHRGAYATGDIVRHDGDGVYTYAGRRDDMVKVRGHRVELGEVEAALATHASLRDVAVVVAGEGRDARLVAVTVAAEGQAPPTLIDLKRHCSERLPRSMIVHELRTVTALPRTRNGKVDRRNLTDNLEVLDR